MCRAVCITWVTGCVGKGEGDTERGQIPRGVCVLLLARRRWRTEIHRAGERVRSTGPE